MDPGSSSQTPQASGSSEIEPIEPKVNDSMYVLHKPKGMPSMHILFFHGLQLVEDYSQAHLSTWESGDGSCIWPQKWLAEEFPGALIVSMTYTMWMGKNANKTVDMYNMGENLIYDLLQEDIGQTLHCPVVLVGHSIGGLIIKQLCSQAQNQLARKRGREKDKLAAFLKSIRGIFFYATPHHGSLATKELVDIVGNPLLKYVETLSRDTERLNRDFEATKELYKWSVAGLGETHPTKLGPSLSVMIAPEASTRCENFATVENADHISICRPTTKTTRSFRKLKLFLVDIDKNMKDEAKVFEEKRAKEEAKAGHQCQGLPDHPVELETRAQDVMKKLRGGAVLGIFGMGGIGKTTLAKQVYNTISRDFEYTGFVDNVKGHDRHQLEDWVLTHFHKRGMKLDRTQWSDLKDTKILLVMDDISSEDQLKCLPKFQHFGKGSCLMMTSRDKEVFKFYKDFSVHEVDCLEEKDSEELFCQNAFGSKEIPNLLQENVKSVVRKCGGLPLTLEVMGHYLRDHTNDAKVWEQTIDKLGKAQSITGSRDDRLWASLKVSYDCLCEEEQDMFIEAANIFFEKPLDEALAGWSSITRNAETTWRNLVNRSLVKEIVEYRPLVNYKCKYVWVHEQLRDLAEKIMNGTMASGMDEEANLLVHQLNTNKVEVRPISLRLDYYSNQEILQLDKLAKMKRLKYMELDGVVCEGRGKGLASHLCILKCKGHYLSGYRDMPRFIQKSVLHAFYISLDKMKNLAVLELRTFVVAKNFPEALGNLTNLQILVLDRLEGLDHLPENFGNLSQLKRLEVGYLRSLKLPKSLGKLKALEHLAFRSIGSLEFPESLGGLTSLVLLHIEEESVATGGWHDNDFPRWHDIDFPPHPDGSVFQFSELRRLQGLPSSFGDLCALEELELEVLELKTLSDSFGHLTRLVKLGITSDELETLPENFYLLKSLRCLKIDCEKLGRLPERLGELTLLEELNLVVNSVKALPESVEKLTSLRFLKFCSKNAKVVPESLGQVRSLETLELDCDSLEVVPESLGQLRSLKTLELDCASLERLPERLGELALLEELELMVDSVKALPESVGNLPSLRVLKFRSKNAGVVPESLGQLRSLKTLELVCARLERLPDGLCELSSVEVVSISAKRLQCLPHNIGALPSLRRLTLNVASVTSLPESIGQSLSLEEFEFDCSWHEATSDLFENLSSFAHPLVLEGLNGAERLPAGLGRLTSLRDLSLEQFSHVESLPEELGELRSLERLTISGCFRLKSLPESLGRISSLREVTLTGCGELKSLPHSLGKPSSREVAMPEGDNTNKRKRQEEESSQTKDTAGMRLLIGFCDFLDDAVLESLGWTVMSKDEWPTCYQRKQTN